MRRSAGGRVENGDLYQQATQRSLLGTAQVGRKQLRDRVAVLRLLDAALTGDNLQTAFVQQCRQPLDHKKQVALHQPHRNRCDDGGKYAESCRLGECFLAAALLLARRSTWASAIGWSASWGDAPGNLAGANLAEFALLAAFGDDGLGGVLARLELRPLRLFFVLGFSCRTSTYLLRGTVVLPSCCLP